MAAAGTSPSELWPLNEAANLAGRSLARFLLHCVSREGITMHALRKLRESGKPTPAQIGELLAEDIVFHSPILVRPVQGCEICSAIFAQSSSTRGSGSYTAEFKLDERTTFLRWVGTMDGHRFESLEVIVDNEQGLIAERTIALRPYPALRLFSRRHVCITPGQTTARCLGVRSGNDPCVVTAGGSDRFEPFDPKPAPRDPGLRPLRRSRKLRLPRHSLQGASLCRCRESAA